MTELDQIRDKVEVIAFDVYTTLLPLEPVFLPAFEEYFASKGVDGDPQDTFDQWRDKYFYQQMVTNIVNEYRRPTIELGYRALSSVFEEMGFEYTDEEVWDLVGNWKELEPHEDVLTGFQRLGEEYTLVGLSNGDPDMLDAVEPGFEGTIDAVISSAKADLYKPKAPAYKLLCEEFDIAIQQSMYVSDVEYDMMGAYHAGMYTCFVERIAPFGNWPMEPDFTVRDIDGLADILTH